LKMDLKKEGPNNPPNESSARKSEKPNWSEGEYVLKNIFFSSKSSVHSSKNGKKKIETSGNVVVKN